MERTGLFSDKAANAEHDALVWRHFFKLCSERVPFQLEEAVSLHLGKYGFCPDPDDDRQGLNFALVMPMIDPVIPVTQAEFLQDASALNESISSHFEHSVICDTFAFLDGFGGAMPHIIQINSPVATFDKYYAAYHESLSSKRRKRYRQVAPNFDSADFRFSLTPELLSATELDFAATMLERKWGEDWPYAFAQLLWPQACAHVRPGSALFMRVYDKDVLVFVQTLLVRGNGVYCQSIFKNEDLFYDGIAPYTDFKCIEALCGMGLQFLDPSCRSSLDDPASIGVAKRATVNANRLKPILAMGRNLPENVVAILGAGVPVGDEV